MIIFYCFFIKILGTVLHQIVIEAVTLLENAGFFVDAITTDGATWNQSMWSKFGISRETISCMHMCDSERRLWFISDFPHLIKNVRNAITDKKFMLVSNYILKIVICT